MYLGLCALAVSNFSDFDPSRPGLYIAWTFGFIFISIVISAAAWRRKNWARVLLFCCYLLGLISLIRDVPYLLTHPLSGLFQLAGTLLEGAAFWFVFTGDSQAWFGKNEPVSPRSERHYDVPHA
jgi:hypothetical protein